MVAGEDGTMDGIEREAGSEDIAMKCLCGCNREVEQHQGGGRQREYYSESCKQKAKRVRERMKRVAKLRESRSKLFVIQVDIAIANEFVRRYHRHNKPVPGSKINLGVVDETGLLRGVAIIGRPVARKLDDGWTLEVNRLASDGCPNACSSLYGAARRIVFELGYQRLITYTLVEESGSSMRGSGWKRVAEIDPATGKGWQSRERVEQRVYNLPKWRWEAIAPKKTHPPFSTVTYPWSGEQVEATEQLKLMEV